MSLQPSLNRKQIPHDIQENLVSQTNICTVVYTLKGFIGEYYTLNPKPDKGHTRNIDYSSYQHLLTS